MTTRKAAHGYAMKRWLDLTQPMPRPQVTLDDVVAEYLRMRKAQGHPVGHVAWESIEAKVKELKETARAKPHQ